MSPHPLSFHKIVFPKVSLREHYFCYAAGNPNYIMIEEIQRTSYITVTFVIFTPSPPLSVGGGPPLPPTFTFLPPSLSLLPLPSVSFSLPLLPSPPSPYLPILPLYPFFSTLSLLPSHPLSLPPPTHSLPPSLKSSPLPPLKHDEDDASGLTLPPSRVRHVICGMHNEIAITITM